MKIFEGLTGKSAIVSGTNSGIGLAIKQSLTAQGVRVIGINRKTTDENSENYICDISDQKQVEETMKKIKKQTGNVDFLVNCAGISLKEKKGVCSAENFDALINNNLKGVYFCSMIAGYNLLNEGGSIVNISSIRARTGTTSCSSGYAAAKAGVINLTKTFALELSERSIRVNCIAPGLVYPTNMSKDLSKEEITTISQSIPLKRLGAPQDIADATLFLLSSSASYITGQTLDVNGGIWMN